MSPNEFALHFSGNTSHWPRAYFSAWRLWDAGVSWAEVQPTKPTYAGSTCISNCGNWTRLDSLVSAAASRHVALIYVMGNTPTWAYNTTSDGTAECSPTEGVSTANRWPVLTFYSAFAKAVAQRYKGKIRFFEVWNEPDLCGYLDKANPAAAYYMTQNLWGTVKSVDSTITVLQPGIATRASTYHCCGVLAWLDKYYSYGAGRYFNIAGIHLYPPTGKGPEAQLATLSNIRAVMAKHGINKPVWDTEVNYQPSSGSFTQTVASGLVARTFLLAPAAHVDRTFWYDWDARSSWVRIWMVNSDYVSMTAAGHAYYQVYYWTRNTYNYGCSHGTTSGSTYFWSCTIKYSNGGSGKPVWTLLSSQHYAVPSGMRRLYRLDGTYANVHAGQVITVTQAPVLLRSF